MFNINPKPAGQDSDGKVKPPTQAEKTSAVILHLSGLSWLPIMPLQVLALIIPFLGLQFARAHSEFVEQHAVQVCNFQMLMACFYVLALIATLFFKTPIFIWWVAIGASLFSVWEAAKAMNGWPAKYPAGLKLFK
ncbi:DUF4870 domain-containing protein [Deefgea salmonis]|uniref:DUF4870 domain-containing protein n=1 Tax=Deefgea salmonis TaxID=2875502 RepID=A0ABS8BLE4_9NEIS|nr:DUF4870 domain-containing protein [Deefgea salmonis]MCB5196535.1 DUF4870 domain-containing protein [Deefgea salmonis]